MKHTYLVKIEWVVLYLLYEKGESVTWSSGKNVQCSAISTFTAGFRALFDPTILKLNGVSATK